MMLTSPDQQYLDLVRLQNDIAGRALRVTTILAVVAAAQVLVAVVQAVVALKQAKAADRQAKAADAQVRAAQKAIVLNIEMADNSSMPTLKFSPLKEQLPYIQLRVFNMGVGSAQRITLGRSRDGEFVADPEISKLYLPTTSLERGDQFDFQVEKSVFTSGGLAVRYESSQNSQIDELLTLDEGILSSKRLQLFRPYHSHTFLD